MISIKLKNVAKNILPLSARQALRNLQKRVLYTYRRFAIIRPIYFSEPMKIIVGAAMTSNDGWYSTNEQWLDITNESDWKKIFRGKSLLTHVVAEHVFEHLTQDECDQALHLIASHMKSGGRIRIAVPDGAHPDPEYLRHVGINGIGADASDHKQLLTMSTLSAMLGNAGFEAQPLEGYVPGGDLLQKPYDINDGYIYRSRANSINMATRNGWDFVDANTSLIVDGIKNG